MINFNPNIVPWESIFNGYVPVFDNSDIDPLKWNDNDFSYFYRKIGLNDRNPSKTITLTLTGVDMSKVKEDALALYQNSYLDFPEVLSSDFCSYCYQHVYNQKIEGQFQILEGTNDSHEFITYGYKNILISPKEGLALLAKVRGHSHPAILLYEYFFGVEPEERSHTQFSDNTLATDYFNKNSGSFLNKDNPNSPLNANGTPSASSKIFIDNLGLSYFTYNTTEKIPMLYNWKKQTPSRMPFYFTPPPPIPSGQDISLMSYTLRDRNYQKSLKECIVTHSHIIFYDQGTLNKKGYDEDGKKLINTLDTNRNAIYAVYDIKTGILLGDSLYIINNSDREALSNEGALNTLENYLTDPSKALYRIENSRKLDKNGLPYFTEYNAYHKVISSPIIISGGNSNPVATVYKQTDEGGIYMASNEFGDASAELALGSIEVEEGSKLKKLSPVTNKTITGLFRAGGAGISIDMDDNLIIESLGKLLALVNVIDIHAESESIKIETESYKSCLNFLITAMESIVLTAKDFDLQAENINLNANNFNLNVPNVVIGSNLSIKKNEQDIGGGLMMDIDGPDSPVTWNKLGAWWNSEVKPAFEVLKGFIETHNTFIENYNVFIAQYNLHEPLPIAPNVAVPSTDIVLNFATPINKAEDISKLSAAKTTKIQ